ncbi:MAG: CAP domain-containing protein [Patescibacteria group bacterium]
MKSRFRITALLAVIVLGCWGCEYFPSSTSPFDPSPSEPGPAVPVAIPIADVIIETNNQRKANNLGSLAENSKLNAAADFKMRDMFARQYFDHYAPDGTSGIEELLIRFNYQYIAAGENLALGDFKNANELVSLWMASPGHKANILNSTYREIGVATDYDMFQGRRTIIAVQIFGTRG